MKKSIFAAGSFSIIVALLFVGGCMDPWEGREYTFKEGFEELNELDKKYNTSFHEEQLNASMVSLEDADAFIEDLRAFREDVRKTKEGGEKDALINFIAVRITMILAQENFQRAQKIGDIGAANDPRGFSCVEVPYIAEATDYYNKTYAYGIKARSDLDSILYEYRKIDQLQELIGMNKNKPKFYYFRLDAIKNIIRANEIAMYQYCKVKQINFVGESSKK